MFKPGINTIGNEGLNVTIEKRHWLGYLIRCQECTISIPPATVDYNYEQSQLKTGVLHGALANQFVYN